MSYDLVIRGGTIVDGTGAPGRPGDVAVRDGQISEVPADVFGFTDRGRLRPGLAADLVVFDAETIAAGEPELIHDLPDGGPRLVQRARGIAWSFVNGGAVVQDGRMPESPERRGCGRVLRPAQA
jgi:N-acyl-D-amino-acid deacylase